MSDTKLSNWFIGGIVSVLLGACGAKPGIVESPPKGNERAEELNSNNGPGGRLADRLEPESLAPLLWNVPSWVIKEVRRAGFSAPELVNAYQGIINEAANSQDSQKTQIVHGVFIALLGLEEHRANDSCDISCLSTITDIYARLSQWDRTESDVLAGAILHNLEWTAVGAERARELNQFFSQVLANSGDSAASSLAALLRVDTKSIDTRNALLVTGRAMGWRARWELARDLLVASVEWSKEPVEPWQIAEASYACYQSLDVECGNRLEKRYLKTELNQERRKRLENHRQLAETVLRTQDEAEVSKRIELGAALADLGRLTHAKGVFADLIEKHPNDARGFVGLGKLLTLEGDPRAASVIAKAGPDNREQDFYELSLGTWFANDVNGALAGEDRARNFEELKGSLPRVRGLVQEYEKFSPARAELLSHLIDAGERIMPILLRDSSEWIFYQREFFDALEGAAQSIGRSAQKYPDDVELARVRLLLAIFDRDMNRAARTIREIAGAKIASVTTMRRNAQFLLGMRKQGKRLMSELGTELASLDNPNTLEKAMSVDVWASSLAQRKNKNWNKVAAKYEALAAVGSAAFRGRFLNNMGVAKYVSGDPEAADKSLRTAMVLEKSSSVPGVNMFAISNDETAAESAHSWVRNVEQDEGALERQMVGAWKIAKEVKNRRQRAAEIKKSLERKPELLDPVNVSLDGAHTTRSVSFEIGYSNVRGLAVEVDLETKMWLWLNPDANR